MPAVAADLAERHVAGSAARWKHGWIPLNAAAEAELKAHPERFHQGVKEGAAEAAKAAKPHFSPEEVKAAQEAMTARAKAAQAREADRKARGLSPGEAAQEIMEAAGHKKAGRSAEEQAKADQRKLVAHMREEERREAAEAGYHGPIRHGGKAPKELETRARHHERQAVAHRKAATAHAAAGRKVQARHHAAAAARSSGRAHGIRGLLHELRAARQYHRSAEGQERGHTLRYLRAFHRARRKASLAGDTIRVIDLQSDTAGTMQVQGTSDGPKVSGIAMSLGSHVRLRHGRKVGRKLQSRPAVLAQYHSMLHRSPGVGHTHKGGKTVNLSCAYCEPGARVDLANPPLETADFGLIDLAAGSMAKATTPRLLGTHALWKKPGFKLPDYIEHVASHFLDRGKSQAIRMAIGIVRNWAQGKPSGGEKGLKATTIAAARLAMAQWERLKAMAKSVKSRKDLAVDGYDPGVLRRIDLAAQQNAGKVKGVAGTSAAERKKASQEGTSLPDGSFPMGTTALLKKAVMAYGRAVRAGKGGAVKALALRQAKKLGAPTSWDELTKWART